MEKISNIKYVDASYFYNGVLPEKLLVHEAYGYVENYGDTIILRFIAKLPESAASKEIVVKGLLIPKTALESTSKSFQLEEINTVKLGSNVSVFWKDTVYTANRQKRTASIMHSKGILEKVADDFIVLESPETIRTYPLPVKNHPEKKPARYLIPKSLIVEIKYD